MKQYCIDELRLNDYEKLKTYLNDRFGSSCLDGLYWVPLVDDLLDEVQASHTDCHPLYFAVQLEPLCISFELLVRTRNRVRCECIRYANGAQREHIIRFADTMFEALKVIT